MATEKLEHCESCGQAIKKLNPHRMDRQKVRVLEDVAKLNGQGYKWVLVREGDALQIPDGPKVRTAYLARSHANRLCWFGLMDNRAPRTGAYRVNKSGYNFLRGNLMVPERIWCRDGAVVERSEKLVTVRQVEGVVLDKAYWDDYWQKQEYADSDFSWGEQQLELM